MLKEESKGQLEPQGLKEQQVLKGHKEVIQELLELQGHKVIKVV